MTRQLSLIVLRMCPETLLSSCRGSMQQGFSLFRVFQYGNWMIFRTRIRVYFMPFGTTRVDEVVLFVLNETGTRDLLCRQQRNGITQHYVASRTVFSTGHVATTQKTHCIVPCRSALYVPSFFDLDRSYSRYCTPHHGGIVCRFAGLKGGFGGDVFILLVGNKARAFGK